MMAREAVATAGYDQEDLERGGLKRIEYNR
jgi:hypothetical protein